MSIANNFIKIPRDLTKRDYKTAKLHQEKNKFNDILASEETRVKIPYIPYINASYILDKYIATQQPLKSTIDDFWSMVYHTNSNLIVNLHGDNMYLPSNPKDMKLIHNSDDIEIRMINMCGRIIHHITYKGWPDYGTPSSSGFIKFYNAYKVFSGNSKVVVHCRAGIGRTGTFILIDYITRKLDPKHILPTLIQMRKSRVGMVQTKLQLEFAENIISRLNSNFSPPSGPPLRTHTNIRKKLSISE